MSESQNTTNILNFTVFCLSAVALVTCVIVCDDLTWILALCNAYGWLLVFLKDIELSKQPAQSPDETGEG